MRSRAARFALSAIAIVLLALGNLPWQLDDYDQAKQAFTSWQVVKSGRVFYQETPGGKIATKPPLLAWVSTAVYEITRSWDLAWRLPSFAAAIALGWLLFRWGGVAAATPFAFNLLSPRIATLVRTDMPLALVIFLIGAQFWWKIRERASWTTRDRALLFALLTASMMIKGPIVYAFVLPAIVVCWWRFRGSQEAIALRSGWWPWIASLAIFVAWAVIGMRTVPGFYEEVVVKEFAGRFGETLHRPQPFWFYLPHLLHKFAPWSLLVIALAFTKQIAARRPEIFWLLAWSLGGLAIMSIIPSKRVDRIFPVIPPLCLLIAAAIDAAPQFKRWFGLTTAAAVLFATGYVGWKVVSGFASDRSDLVRMGRAVRTRVAGDKLNLAAVKENDEGIPMYVNLPGFTSAEDAAAGWKDGRVTALLTTERRLPMLQLQHADALRIEPLATTGDGKSRYVLVTRNASP